MNYRSPILYTTLSIFIIAGIASCSKQKETHHVDMVDSIMILPDAISIDESPQLISHEYFKMASVDWIHFTKGPLSSIITYGDKTINKFDWGKLAPDSIKPYSVQNILGIRFKDMSFNDWGYYERWSFLKVEDISITDSLNHYGLNYLGMIKLEPSLALIKAVYQRGDNDTAFVHYEGYWVNEVNKDTPAHFIINTSSVLDLDSIEFTPIKNYYRNDSTLKVHLDDNDSTVLKGDLIEIYGSLNNQNIEFAETPRPHEIHSYQIKLNSNHTYAVTYWEFDCCWKGSLIYKRNNNKLIREALFDFEGDI